MDNRNFKKVLITGITGSGGSYLADYIAQNHPEVEIYGMSRWHSTTSSKNLSLNHKAQVFECDLNDFSAIFSVLKKIKPDAIFHLASHANVRASFINPLAVMQNNVMATSNLLEAVRLAEIDPVVQICSTSEVYGIVDPKYIPIKEDTPMNPGNPYAVSKIAQDLLGYVYFKSYGMKIIRTRMFSYI
ncbi:MAG: GDP-mannose 4,6-dehydratase, partial [Parcubacteria group bacterium GW2011_GWA2_38_13]